MKFGLLEFGDIENSYDYQGLIDYVTRADELGYNRIWLGEHYAPDLAFTNPEPLLPVIANQTHRIRVGIGGVLLRYHSPYRLATYYKLLGNLFMDRIDLGLCKTSLPGNFGSILLGTTSDAIANEFDRQLNELQSFFDDQQVSAIDGAVNLPPAQSHTKPSLWILNSAFEDIRKYPGRNLNFCRSLFHNSGSLRNEEIEILRAQPAVAKAVAIAVYCSECKSQNESFERTIRKRQGLMSKNVLCCTPQEVGDYVHHLQSTVSIDEVIILNLGRNYLEKGAIIDLLQKQFKNDFV